LPANLFRLHVQILFCNLHRALRDTKLSRPPEYFLRRNWFYKYPSELVLHQRCLGLHRTYAGENVINRDVAIANPLKAVFGVKLESD